MFIDDSPTASDVYMLKYAYKRYYAVFNFTNMPKRISVPIERYMGENYTFTADELWTGEQIKLEDELTVTIPAKSARIYYVY